MKQLAFWGRVKMAANQLLVLACSVFVSTITYANPVLDHVAAGHVSIQQAPNSTVINQVSQQAIINWQSFNIGAQESTHFQQPMGGVAYNRINGSNGASQIYGRLTATGKIILSNSAGIYFGPTAYVNVGGLMATTSGLSDQDFLNGYYHFSAISPLAGMVVNEGQIIAADHGLVALMGNGVSNNGMIEAKMGQVVLASGNAFTMNFAGNDMIGFRVDEKATQAVTNQGSIQAEGGSILVTAKMAAGVLDNVINMKGFTEAKSVGMQDGNIIISGDMDGGVVNIAGELNASAITVSGYNILLDSTANLNAQSALRGGTVLIGGNYQGNGPIPNSNALVMMPGAMINADGKHGQVVLWSDYVTKAYGNISAQGGLVETSSKGYIDVSGLRVQAATWLLDPADITIASNGGSNTLVTGSSPFTATATGGSILDVGILTTALGSGNVIVQTLNDGFAGNGDIIIAAAIAYNSIYSLTLSAYRSITSTLSNAVINNAGTGAVLLRADNTGTGTGTVSLTGTTPNVTAATGGVKVYYNPTTYGTQDTIYSGGTTPTKYMLVNTTTKFQNINSFLSGNFALSKDLDFSGFSYSPLSSYSGKFDGQNFALYNVSSSSGVFNTIASAGVVSNLILS